MEIVANPFDNRHAHFVQSQHQSQQNNEERPQQFSTIAEKS